MFYTDIAFNRFHKQAWPHVYFQCYVAINHYRYFFKIKISFLKMVIINMHIMMIIMTKIIRIMACTE